MNDQVTERAAALSNDGCGWDAILTTLRAEGFSKVECIKATVEVLGLPLADAKRLIHGSEAWADVRQRDEEVHEALIAEVESAALRD